MYNFVIVWQHNLIQVSDYSDTDLDNSKLPYHDKNYTSLFLYFFSSIKKVIPTGFLIKRVSDANKVRPVTKSDL